MFPHTVVVDSLLGLLHGMAIETLPLLFAYLTHFLYHLSQSYLLDPYDIPTDYLLCFDSIFMFPPVLLISHFITKHN